MAKEGTIINESQLSEFETVMKNRGAEEVHVEKA